MQSDQDWQSEGNSSVNFRMRQETRHNYTRPNACIKRSNKRLAKERILILNQDSEKNN